MEALIAYTGVVAPFDHSNVDTDAILPKEFLKSVERTGYGIHLFEGLRYRTPYVEDSTANRLENPGFVLNDERYRRAGILLSRANFGCGSSREHAVWALQQFGIRVVIAESFSDIFQSNALRNGLLTVVLAPLQISTLFDAVQEVAGLQITVDLKQQKVVIDEVTQFEFSMASAYREALMQGLDEIDQTLAKSAEIKAFEHRRLNLYPWV
jgi:3-isopropylmalate/(R)-2-methylmalate dehydratase small subunit